MKTKIIIVIFALASLLVSCATIAEIGAAVGEATGVIDSKQASIIKKTGVALDAGKKAFEEINPEQEYYIGRAVGANVLAAYKLQTNTPALTAYINKICGALIINSLRPEIFNGYHAAILDTDEINAFATPGGHIFLTRGLIKCAASEDALAAVIAHEIAHIQFEHGLKAIKDSRKAEFGKAAVDVLSVATTGKELEEITNTFRLGVDDIVNSLMKGYSREQEFEADSMAMALLELIGYEPSSLLDMLKVLEKDQPDKRGGFNDTHPTPAQRIENVQKTLGNYQVADTRPYRVERFRALN